MHKCKYCEKAYELGGLAFIADYERNIVAYRKYKEEAIQLQNKCQGAPTAYSNGYRDTKGNTKMSSRPMTEAEWVS